jgi:hypothetical protein
MFIVPVSFSVSSIIQLHYLLSQIHSATETKA